MKTRDQKPLPGHELPSLIRWRTWLTILCLQLGIAFTEQSFPYYSLLLLTTRSLGVGNKESGIWPSHTSGNSPYKQVLYNLQKEHSSKNSSVR